MRLSDCTLLTEQQRLDAQKLFGIIISKEPTAVLFEDVTGNFDVPNLEVTYWNPDGIAMQVLGAWATGKLSSIEPNEAALVWWSGSYGQPKWNVQTFPRICKTTMAADGLSDDEVVTLTTDPEKHVYLFFKDTLLGQQSLVHPFSKFKVPKECFSLEHLADLVALGIAPASAVEVAASDYEQFKTLFDKMGQRYTAVTLAPGEAEQKGYSKDIIHGIALMQPTTNPPRQQRFHWRALDEYTSAFYFDGDGKYVGTAILPS